MSPVIPHFSNECLQNLNSKESSWPSYDENILYEDKIKIVVQINGKKRSLLQTKPGISEENVLELINNDKTLLKYLNNANIKRKIYVKDKLINLII